MIGESRGAEEMTPEARGGSDSTVGDTVDRASEPGDLAGSASLGDHTLGDSASER